MLIYIKKNEVTVKKTTIYINGTNMIKLIKLYARR
jgi:hypothetical protein